MISPATTADIPALVTLINSAYRGEASKTGWTTEAYIITGDKRTDPEHLNLEFSDASVTILKYEDDENGLAGCVYLKNMGDRLYLGMLSVNPKLQDRGIGKQLMLEAESFAMGNGIFLIEMNVINLRTELIAWYKKLGYKSSDLTRPFPQNQFGSPVKPLHFEVLAKPLP